MMQSIAFLIETPLELHFSSSSPVHRWVMGESLLPLLVSQHWHTRKLQSDVLLLCIPPCTSERKLKKWGEWQETIAFLTPFELRHGVHMLNLLNLKANYACQESCSLSWNWNVRFSFVNQLHLSWRTIYTTPPTTLNWLAGGTSLTRLVGCSLSDL